LDGWLDHHRTGWHGMMTEAASEPAQLSLSLKDCDGAVTSISVIERANGSRYLRVLGPEPWTYESFLGLSKSRAATRPVSNQELTALEQIVRGTRSGLRALEEQRSVSSTLSFAVNRSHHPEAESWK
jgi:hypothetical protein